MQFSAAPFFKTPWYWLTLLAALGAGAVTAFSMAPTHIWPLALIGIGFVYFLQFNAIKPRHAFYFGWLFSFAFFVISLSWIGNALLVEGNDYKWAWPLAVSGLPAYLAIYPALACYFARKLFPSQHLKNFIAFIALMVLAEWLRGNLLSGFPWNLYGYTWGGILEMLQITHFSNIYLLSGLTIFWASALALPFVKAPRHFSYAFLALALLSAGGTYYYGAQRLAKATIETQAEENLTFKIVQPNVDQAEKWDMKQIHNHFVRMLDLSVPDGTEKQTTIIVWPETAISQYLLNNNNYTALLKDLLSSYQNDVFLITGALLNDDRLTNSMIIINKQGEITARYDKFHLVPFGEYMPLRQWIPLKTITNFSGFDKGDGLHTITVMDNFKISPLVCYEIIFPSRVVEDGTQPNVIINSTNDAWYGVSAGPYQHLLKARLRAIEEEIPVIRSANTGISAFIDPFGRVLAETELYKTTFINKNYILEQ